MKICLAGATPDTSNLGVSALFAATLAGLNQRLHNAQFIVFDNGTGARSTEFTVGESTKVQVELRGIRGGRRYFRSGNLGTANAMAKLGAVGRGLNSTVRCIDECDVVLDISGGDSFSDIYGMDRFNSVNGPKRIANLRRTQLILLPQTYGPFSTRQVEENAAQLVRRADSCWARDSHSFEILKKLLGKSFAPSHHLEGVDVAFGLEPRPFTKLGSTKFQQMIASDRPHTLVGLNISGLIYNDSTASARFGFIDDYATTVTQLVYRILETPNTKIILIPHVVCQQGLESDPIACQHLLDNLPSELQSRVMIAPRGYDQNEAKWLISRCDWFCGTRMHATIAGLSTKTPTATINYSDKAKGVFESCGQGSHVFDPRKLGAKQIISGLTQSLQRRSETCVSLASHLPIVMDQIDKQLDTIAGSISTKRDRLNRSNT